MTFIKKFASKLGVLDYKGMWNASTNTPDIVTPIPKKGYYYIVSTAGNTNLDGISSWEAGDWVIHNGLNWQKMDAADKAKTSQLETSISTLTSSVENLTIATNNLPNLSETVYELETASELYKDFKLSEVFYVAKNGNDVSGAGSLLNPFASISGALSKIQTLSIDQEKDVLIIVAPGVYAENVTISRPKTHLMGLVSSRSNTVNIAGSVTINPSYVSSGVYNSLFTLENLLISPSAGDAITITGSNECNVCITNVYCYTSGAGVKRGIVSNQTSNTKTRIQIVNTLINNVSTNSNCLYLQNTYTTAQYLTCYAGASEVIQLSGATLTANNSWLENNYSSHVVATNNTSIFSIGSSYIYNKYQNGSGISAAAGAQIVCVNNIFQITGTSGFAVSGVLGSVFMHANNCFVYGTSNKISNAISSGNIPMSTSFTPA